MRGDYLEAIATLGANVDLLRREPAHEPGPLGFPASLASGTWLSFALAELGRFGEAIATAEEVVQEAETLAHVYSLYHGYWALGAAYLEKGEHERAVEPLRQVQRIAMQADLQPMAANATGLFGRTHALGGHLAEALELLEGVPLAGEHRNAFTGQRDNFYLGDAYLRAGRVDDALRTARQALDFARTSEMRGREAYALELLANVHTARGAEGDAEESYRGALALGGERGMRPLVAHCHLGLGKLYKRTGKHQQAQEHLGTATTLYREMDMRFWLAQAEGEAL